MKLKANPFLMLAEDYHEFRPMQTLLKALIPDCDVTFKEVAFDEVEKMDNRDEVSITTGGNACYAAWFTIASKTPITMSVEDVKKAFEWVWADLLEDAMSDDAIEHELVDMYNADAKDYQRIVDLFAMGEIPSALAAHCQLDTASRGRIWGAPIILENEVGFAVFLEENKYPNRLGEYVFF